MTAFVSVENTPNPLVKKFSAGAPIASVPFDATAMSDRFPHLRVLLDAGAVSIFVGQDHLAVGVAGVDDWKECLGPIREAVSLIAGQLSALEGDPEAAVTQGDESDPVVARIRELIDTRIRPAVAHDGGDVRFRSFQGGVLALEMAGACSGCPSSAATLKQGILTMMRYFIPEVKDVIAA